MNTKRDISVICSDFDGTFGHGKTIPAGNIDTISRFLDSRQDRRLILASARPPYSLKSIIDGSSLRVYQDRIFYMGFNGANLEIDGETIIDQPLSKEQVSGIELKARHLLGCFTFTDQSVVSLKDDAMRKIYSQLFGFEVVARKFKDDEKPYFVELWRGNEIDETSFKELTNDPSGKTRSYAFFSKMTIPGLVQLRHVLPTGVDKANALNAYLMHENLSPEQVLVAGDDINDEGMLSIDGALAVTFNDANKKMKNIRGIYVAPNSRDSGFGRAIDALVKF